MAGKATLLSKLSSVRCKSNFQNLVFECFGCRKSWRVKKVEYAGLSKKMDGIWNRYNLKSTGRIYTFWVLKRSEKFEVLDLP